MTNVTIETPDVLMYYQIEFIFATTDQPDLFNHHYSIPTYLLSVTGFMELKSKEKKCIIRWVHFLSIKPPKLRKINIIVVMILKILT